jgi:hypothetical protein
MRLVDARRSIVDVREMRAYDLQESPSFTTLRAKVSTEENVGRSGAVDESLAVTQPRGTQLF